MNYLHNKNIHFVGIGGIGMCGLAELLHNSGSLVTGSDLQENSEVLHLKKLGISIAIGHCVTNLNKNTDILVYSSAVKKSNIEVKEAKLRSIPVIHRAEALAEMMRLKQGIVIAGSHGKTTSTALLANMFFNAGKSPTCVAGGRLDVFKSTAHLGNSEWFIVESDESDGSFHHLFPEIILLTNIDDDHMNFYGSLLEIKKSFSTFLKKIPFYGAVIACGDCENSREVLQNLFDRKIWLYGFKEHNDFVLKKQGSDYEIFYKKKLWSKMQVPLRGDYNALNALGAFICSWEAGLNKDQIIKGIKSFRGVKRRRELKKEIRNCLFFDDYAHHPVEISAVLSSLREEFPKRRILVLFQPHRFTRFKQCWDRFLKCFSDADRLFIMPVYSAGEPALKSYDSLNFIKQFKDIPIQLVKKEQIFDVFSSEIKEQDLFITLGAGSVSKYHDQLLVDLQKS